jgi:hypothetical protein
MDMMGGMVGGAFGAVGSIVAADIAAKAQRYSADMNWSIALMNYYAREREKFDAKIEASRIENKQNLGMTDAEGTRTKFVEGKGWVTEETPQKTALRSRANAEQMAQFTDAALKRRQIEGTRSRQIAEGDYAHALFDEMRHRSPVTPTNLSNLLFNKQTTEANQAFKDTAAIGARHAMRTGGDPGPIFREIGRAQAKAQGEAKTSADLQGMQLASSINAEDQKTKANLYNMFATRASAMPDVSFAAPGMDNSSLMQAMKGGQEASQGGLKVAMMEGGRLPFVPPNYGNANLAGAIGAAGQGFFKNMGQNSNNLFSDGGGGGLWGAINDDYRRLRQNQGEYA